MSRAEDQQRMKEIFDELARGNGAPFLDAMADDFCWMIIGTTSWSGFYRGKEAVRADLLAPLLAQFADRYTNTAHRILAHEDYVVVECRSRHDEERYSLQQCLLLRDPHGRRHDGRADGVLRHRAHRVGARAPPELRWRILVAFTSASSRSARTRSLFAIQWYEAQGLDPGIERDDDGMTVGSDGLPRPPDDGYQSSQAAARIVATGDEDLALF
jgi:ketosteroid isomerase-like protein